MILCKYNGTSPPRIYIVGISCVTVSVVCDVSGMVLIYADPIYIFWMSDNPTFSPFIVLAIVWKVALDAVLTPLPVIALAISDFPLLTDVFKELISEDALHWIVEGWVYTVSFVSSSLFLPA